MVRVGYPATIAAELLSGFPSGVELVPLTEDLDHDVPIDVWIPDPYPPRAMRVASRLQGLRLVLSLMAGTEWIPGVVGPHVTISNAQGAHSISTAEWTVTAILASLKHLPLYLDLQRSEEWRRRYEASEQYARITGDPERRYPPVLVEELTGKTVLLVGHGAIGKEIERMLAPFHPRMLRVARSARTHPAVEPITSLHALIPQAEVIVLILPLTAETRHLVGARELALMGQGTLLVNAARGPIVDTDALVEALRAGRIRAALDVTDPEPLPPGHPLWSCPNLLITPHVAGSSPQFSPRALRTAEEELRRYIAGEPLSNVVRPAV